MERKDAVSLGELLRLSIEASENSRRFDEVTAINSWPYIVGPEVAGKSPRPFVKNGVMYVRLQNAGLRQELNMQRSALCEALNRKVGKDIISEIRFIG